MLGQLKEGQGIGYDDRVGIFAKQNDRVFHCEKAFAENIDIAANILRDNGANLVADEARKVIELEFLASMVQGAQLSAKKYGLPLGDVLMELALMRKEEKTNPPDDNKSQTARRLLRILKTLRGEVKPDYYADWKKEMILQFDEMHCAIIAICDFVDDIDEKSPVKEGLEELAGDLEYAFNRFADALNDFEVCIEYDGDDFD